MGPLDENYVLHIAREVLLALSYLHSNNIIHRDIKAANILLTEKGEIKLGDFGVASQVISNLRRNSFVGSPYWMAPEVIKRSQYDSKADIWSFGITLFEFLKGEPPLASIEPARAIFIIPNHSPPRLDSSFGESLRALVNSCLHDDPQKRPSADELLRLRVFRHWKRASSHLPLDGLVAQYKLIKKNQEVGEQQSSLALEDGGTVGSIWTFGTFNSSEDTLSTINNNKEDSNDISNLLRSASIEDKTLLSPKLGTISSSNPIAANDLSSSGHLRGLSSSSTCLTGLSGSFSEPTSKTLSHHPKMSSSSCLVHDRHLSLLSIPCAGTDQNDPLCLVAEIINQQKIRRDAEFCLYEWPWAVVEEDRINKTLVYQLMTRLKQSSLDLPALTDPCATESDLRRHIHKQIQYSEKYITLIEEAVEIINRISPNHNN